MNKDTTISILGCGWYGLNLGKTLAAEGFCVKGSTTSPEKMQSLKDNNIVPFVVNFLPETENYDPGFFACDILWIAIPPKSKTGGADNYIKRIARIMNAAEKYEIKQVVHISSTGVYGDNNEEVDELTPPQPLSPSGKALLQVENLLREQGDFTTTIIRFGGLLGPGRPAGRFFAGRKQVPNGKAPVNLIHLDDCLGISLAILNKEAFGCTFNACSPEHPEKADFYTRAAINADFDQPEFIEELLEWKVVNSIYIDEILGFKFKVRLI